VEAARDALESGLHITVFPEGTRSLDGKLLPFKKGAFFLAAETGAPMVPVVLRGTRQMMPKGTLKIVPGEAVVEFLEPILPGDFETREELMKAVRGAMERCLERVG
jgi:1-acyl-sn-glycerol-3-phosphate acyltransferase